jgi:hypothetical protein
MEAHMPTATIVSGVLATAPCQLTGVRQVTPGGPGLFSTQRTPPADRLYTEPVTPTLCAGWPPAGYGGGASMVVCTVGIFCRSVLANGQYAVDYS